MYHRHGLIVKYPEKQESGLGKKGSDTITPRACCGIQRGDCVLDLRVGQGVNPQTQHVLKRRYHRATWTFVTVQLHNLMYPLVKL